MATPESILKTADEKMQKAVAATQQELAVIRTGRPNPGILDRVTIDYYGTPAPIKQVANISVQDGSVLLIQPYDRGQLSDIEKAISKSDLGLNPNNDGSVLRINIPPLSAERRQEMVKTVKKMGEDGKVAIRNIRRDAADELNKLKKEAALSEDQLRGELDDLQKLTDNRVKDIENLLAAKEKDILTV